MSGHEGVSCDACGKSNFRSKRFKCLICYDYDLCSTCHEQGEVSSDHTATHPMQCILTRQDYELYYHGERFTSDQPQSLTCPYCGELGFSLPYLNDSSSASNNSTQNLDLLQHLQLKHSNDQQSPEVICPICASTASGEPNLVTADLISHIANDHPQSQGNSSSSTNDGISVYSRPGGVPSREYDFGIGTGIRGGFRRGSLRATSRRGGLGRGGGPVSQHFVVDTSGLAASGNGNDPIADLLSQLSSVRRLAAASSNSNTSNNNPLSTPVNTINLQALTRQQYERERLRATLGRSHHHQYHHHHPHPQSSHSSQSTGASDNLSLVENDLFDSLLSSALFVDPSTSSTNPHQSWTHLLSPSHAQQQSASDHQSQPNSTTKLPQTAPVDSDPSLLRRMCNETSSSLSPQNTAIVSMPKPKSDFVQCLLLSSFATSSDENE